MRTSSMELDDNDDDIAIACIVNVIKILVPKTGADVSTATLL